MRLFLQLPRLVDIQRTSLSGHTPGFGDRYISSVTASPPPGGPRNWRSIIFFSKKSFCEKKYFLGGKACDRKSFIKKQKTKKTFFRRKITAPEKRKLLNCHIYQDFAAHEKWHVQYCSLGKFIVGQSGGGD